MPFIDTNLFLLSTIINISKITAMDAYEYLINIYNAP